MTMTADTSTTIVEDTAAVWAAMGDIIEDYVGVACIARENSSHDIAGLGRNGRVMDDSNVDAAGGTSATDTVEGCRRYRRGREGLGHDGCLLGMIRWQRCHNVG